MYRHRFDILLGTLVLLMLSAPGVLLLSGDSSKFLASVAVSVILSAMLLSAVFAVSRTRRTVIVALSLAVPAIVLRVLHVWLGRDAFLIGEHLLEILFLGYVIVVLLKHLFRAERVSFDTICASVCAYLLLATIWAMVYPVLDVLQPGSFAFSFAEPGQNSLMRLGDEKSVYPLYFSVVTMTTLGYGDIVPTSPAAQMLAAVEALTGQLYLAVLVARLVGLQIAQSIRRGSA